jgi:hypothetical protein
MSSLRDWGDIFDDLPSLRDWGIARVCADPGLKSLVVICPRTATGEWVLSRMYGVRDPRTAQSCVRGRRPAHSADACAQGRIIRPTES